MRQNQASKNNWQNILLYIIFLYLHIVIKTIIIISSQAWKGWTFEWMY